MRNDVDEFDDLIPTFFNREENKFELYDDNMNTIDDCVYTFEKDGIHLIKMIIKEKINNFSYIFYKLQKIKVNKWIY